MPARILAGAMCVQRFDGSLNSAIHITYRISLRSSSMPEPRDPLLKVLIILFLVCSDGFSGLKKGSEGPPPPAGGGRLGGSLPPSRPRRRKQREQTGVRFARVGSCKLGNDPSAGSPTETLLRLLLPLNDRVWIAFRPGRVVAHPSGPVRKPH